MYCIYLDKEIDEKITSLQHIVPLALGGANEFSIKIDRAINSMLSSKIEGPLSNELIMKLKQIHNECRGQSGSIPRISIKADMKGHPVSIKWSKECIDVFEPINKKHL